MKAIVFTEKNHVEIQDRPKPTIQQKKQVIVRVKDVGICGSDVHNLKGTIGSPSYPLIPCHEFVGIVDEVGSGVTKVKCGDRVVVEPITYCGECYACRHGRQNVCKSVRTAGSHFDGGLCEFFLTTEDKLFQIPEGMTFHQAVLAEPYTIGLQVNSRARTSPGDYMLIHGAGPIGLIVMDVAKKIGAKVIVSEIKQGRLSMAKEFGADYIINPLQQDLKEEVMRITDGMGPNVIVDAAGLPKMLTEAVELVSPAGSIVNMCFSNVPVKVNTMQFILKEISLVGSRLQNDKFPVILSDYADRLVAFEKLITHTFPAEQGVEAFALAAEGRDDVGKIVIEF